MTEEWTKNDNGDLWNAFLEGIKAFELQTDLPYSYKEGTVLAKAWLKGWKHGWLEFHRKNNQ